MEAACRVAARAIHTEPGCERFALHRGVDGSNSLVLVEKWSSAAALDEHTTAPAYAELGELADGLPRKERAAVVLRYGYDMSYAAIGAALGSSEDAARQAASSGVRRLRRRMQ